MPTSLPTGQLPSLIRASLIVTSVYLVGIQAAYAQDTATVPNSELAGSGSRGVEYFENHIRPLLARRCYSCHSLRDDAAEGELQLDTRGGWVKGGQHGPALVPGDVDASLLIQVVRYADPEMGMPPDNPLSKAEISKLENWVSMGAPDPRDGTSRDPVSPAPHDPIAGRDHWAFQPLGDTSLPPTQDASWPRTGIDSFVLAQLEATGLQPTADVSRRKLARRIYLQLTGLPPTPREMDHFIRDVRPDAIERLVDKLLESPHFGERWGRHWLDLARYADSNGLDENFLFREAWRYRNWVIDAINDDVPFDRFLTLQIAGDLLPFESVSQRDTQRIAAGFLVVGPKVLLGNDPRRQRMEVADEQLDTLGKAILGQTLGCARCHDHKFDPIPTSDYYALAGIMTSTEVMETRHMLNQQRRMERLVGLGSDGESLDSAYEDYWRTRPAVQSRLARAKTALDLIKKKDTQALEKHRAEHPDAVAEPVAEEGAEADLTGLQQSLIKQLQQTLTEQPSIPPRAMIPRDREEVADEHVRLAGEFDRPGKEVARGFLTVLGEHDFEIREGQSGRLQLARWLTDTEHGAGRLTARVMANRIWHHLIGRGIVRTVDNFGRTGELPSHPALLDYLAQRLIDADWSVKKLVREIVISRTFRMGSEHVPAAHAIDPENRLHWRAHRRRLDPESLRDAMLLASGTLDLSGMDSSVWYLGDQATAVGANKNRRRTDFPNRSVYLPVIRNDLPELFDVFDFADPHATTGMRPQTMVATQGLFILNDRSVLAAADATATRILAELPTASTRTRIERMYELILGENPDKSDRQRLKHYIGNTKREIASSNGIESEDEVDAEHRAWSLACQVLFASSRFQMID